MTHEKVIEIRWSDVDAYLHVNNAVYATYLEECRDEWVGRTLEGVGDAWDFVLARVAIVRIGNSSIALREQIRTRAGDLAAEAEAVLVARDREAGRSRPLSEPERAAFERVLEA
jgi:acyl-CoA thioester hydrolase